MKLDLFNPQMMTSKELEPWMDEVMKLMNEKEKLYGKDNLFGELMKLNQRVLMS